MCLCDNKSVEAKVKVSSNHVKLKFLPGVIITCRNINFIPASKPKIAVKTSTLVHTHTLKNGIYNVKDVV